jgi:hypothetical protein
MQKLLFIFLPILLLGASASTTSKDGPKYQNHTMQIGKNELTYTIEPNTWQEFSIPMLVMEEDSESNTSITMTNFVNQLTQKSSDRIHIIWGRRSTLDFQWIAYNPVLENFYNAVSPNGSFITTYNTALPYYIKTNDYIYQTVPTQPLNSRALMFNPGWNTFAPFDKIFRVDELFGLLNGESLLWVKDDSGAWTSYRSSDTIDTNETIGMGKMIYLYNGGLATNQNLDEFGEYMFVEEVVSDLTLSVEENLSGLVVDNNSKPVIINTVRLFVQSAKVDDNVTSDPDIQLIAYDASGTRFQGYIPGVYAGDTLVQLEVNATADGSDTVNVFDLNLQFIARGDTVELVLDEQTSTPFKLTTASLSYDPIGTGSFSELANSERFLMRFTNENGYNVADVNATHLNFQWFEFDQGVWKDNADDVFSPAVTINSDTNITLTAPDDSQMQMILQAKNEILSLNDTPLTEFYDAPVFETQATLIGVQAADPSKIEWRSHDWRPADHNGSVTTFEALIGYLVTSNSWINSQYHAMLKDNYDVVEGVADYAQTGCGDEGCWKRGSNVIGQWQEVSLNGQEAIKITYNDNPWVRYLRLDTTYTIEEAEEMKVGAQETLTIYNTTASGSNDALHQLIRAKLFNVTEAFETSQLHYQTYYAVNIDTPSGPHMAKYYFYDNGTFEMSDYNSSTDGFGSVTNLTFNIDDRGVINVDYSVEPYGALNIYLHFIENDGSLQTGFYATTHFLEQRRWFTDLNAAKEYANAHGASFYNY